LEIGVQPDLKMMIKKILGLRFFKASLRIKVSLVFILPMLLILSATFYIHSRQEWIDWKEVTSTISFQVGDITLASLKHAMQKNDKSMLADILSNIHTNSLIQQLWILDNTGEIKQSTNPEDVGNIMPMGKTGCSECHQSTSDERPRSIIISMDTSYLRVSIPIPNDTECQSCHGINNLHLGVLLVDASLAGANAYYKQELKTNTIITLVSLAVILLFAFLTVRWLIERRIGLITDSLSAFASGDHSVRVPKIWHTTDEITLMAETFNSMADQLTRQAQEMEERTHVRENAIVEERERIGRELHDGIAQFLGYVITKTQAARLFLEKNLVKKAMDNLRSIEDETLKQAMDVRGSILGLKAFTQPGRGLAYDIEDYLVQSNRFMDVQVEAELDPQVNNKNLDGETRLQLLRILQEAISNIRKHSRAKHAWVSLKLITPAMLELQVRDDGIGFDMEKVTKDESHHFGLVTMQDRARSISAQFEVSSVYNLGTTVTVRLALTEKDL
jgi:signal transduction histidine kinase